MSSQACALNRLYNSTSVGVGSHRLSTRESASVLVWTQQPLVEASEVALVFLLAVHLSGGLRLLLAEFGGWRASWQPAAIAAAGGVAALCALLFALNLA